MPESLDRTLQTDVMGHPNRSLSRVPTPTIALLQTAAGAFVVVKSLDWRRWSRPANVAKTRGRLRNADVACGCVLSQGKRR
jgi:hypothetical protein